VLSLHYAQEINGVRAGHVCLPLCLPVVYAHDSTVNHSMDLVEIWYGACAIGNNPKTVFFNFISSVIAK
jgi:hypothetical protein